MDYINRLLNIRNVDYKDSIFKIVSDEKEKLLQVVDGLDGFCKYIANQIEFRLKEIGVRTYIIDLYDMDIDHVFLICEYRYGNEMIRYLIDPTYIQFTKGIGKKLVGLSWWPSDKLDKNILKELLFNGLIRLDNYILNNYLNSFGYCDKNIDIDEYLMSIRMNRLK